MGYIATKQLPASLRGIISKYHGDFYRLDYLRSFRTENKRESY